MSWESISLSEALRPLKSSPFTRDELNYSEGQYQNVHYGDILVRFPSVVDAEKEGLPYVSDLAEGRCSRCSLLQNGDIIIADTAEDEAVGKAIEIQGIKDQKVVSGLHTMAFRPQEGIFAPGFLGYFLNSSAYHNQLLPLMQGIKVLSISKTAIGDTVIKYPSYKEQEKIVESLSGVDAMIGALDEAIAKKRQIKEGLMQQLLMGKTRLPGFSGEWKESTLGQLADICKGVQFDSDLFSENGRYPMLNGGITPSGYSELFNTEADTITISEGGNSCGYVNYMTEKFWCGGHCYSLRVKSVDKLFLYQLLKFNEKDIMALRVGSGLPNVQSKSLLDFRLFYSEDEQEQKSISIILKKADDEIAGLESQRDKYTLIKQGMMQELLTGKTRLI